MVTAIAMYRDLGMTEWLDRATKIAERVSGR